MFWHICSRAARRAGDPGDRHPREPSSRAERERVGALRVACLAVGTAPFLLIRPARMAVPGVGAVDGDRHLAPPGSPSTSRIGRRPLAAMPILATFAVIVDRPIRAAGGSCRRGAAAAGSPASAGLRRPPSSPARDRCGGGAAANGSPAALEHRRPARGSELRSIAVLRRELGASGPAHASPVVLEAGDPPAWLRAAGGPRGVVGPHRRCPAQCGAVRAAAEGLKRERTGSLWQRQLAGRRSARATLDGRGRAVLGPGAARRRLTIASIGGLVPTLLSSARRRRGTSGRPRPANL